MQKLNFLFATGLLLLLAACKNKSTTADKPAGLYNETHRPQYHFSPPKNWMNDPNGMVYYDGEYHLFYQHYPDSNAWGPMHWGHAISTDMVNWKHQPVALFPDSLGYIFSGSAVVDRTNSSGFGTKDTPAMVAVYTYHSMECEKAGRVDFQNQGIAYSVDKGRSWKKFEGNPVLKNPGIKDFRDPKVVWHEATQQWIMALAVKDKVNFYTSPNLKEWNKSSDFNPPWASYGGVWECPDLFPLKTQEGKDKWALLVSINPGAPNGGSGTQYFVGDFDGKEFKANQNEIKWLDYGADNYAGVTFSDIPPTDGRRLFIGWMSNWLYAQQVPTEVWRSAMTVPRVLELIENNGQFLLHSKPIDELKKLRKSTTEVTAAAISLTSDLTELELTTAAEDFKLVFSNEKGEQVVLEKKGEQIIFDRSRSGIISFNEQFPKIHYAPAKGMSVRKIRVFIDRSSIEFFFNDGERVLTELVFPTSAYTKLVTTGLGRKAIVHQLASVWGN